MGSIFVAIASFCDPYLEHTVQDACRKAKFPNNIRFGIVDQNIENRRQTLKDLPESPNICYTRVDPVDSRGVCWARSLTYTLYQNETYFLQIDSHMLFEQDWDVQLIEYLELLRLTYIKPIITIYPYGFEFEDGEAIVKIDISDKTTLVLRPSPDTEPLSKDNATLRFQAEHVFEREYIMGGHIAGGFIFTLGRFVKEIPYDPYLYFHGEEQNLAIRAFTHGWDIFHPPHIPLFHLYKMPNTDHKTHHWHPTWEQQRDYSWHRLDTLSKQRMVDLLYKRKNMGVYGLGTARTLEDFARLTGIDYNNQRVVVREYQKSYDIDYQPQEDVAATATTETDNPENTTEVVVSKDTENS